MAATLEQRMGWAETPSRAEIDSAAAALGVLYGLAVSATYTTEVLERIDAAKEELRRMVMFVATVEKNEREAQS